MDKQPHVIHLLPYLETGGTEKHVLTLITTLKRLNLCTGEVLAPSGPFVAELQASDIKYTEFTSASKGVLASYRNFSKAFRTRVSQADIVHVHGSPDLVLFAAMTKAGRQPRVLTVHGFHGQGAKVSYRFAAMVGNRFAQAVICVAGSEEHLLLHAGMRKDKLHRIYNGVADPLDNQVTIVPSQNLAVRVAFIGRLNHVKGLDVLLRALQRLVQEHTQSVVLDVMGVGDEADTLQDLARELQIADHVTFHGFCREAARRLASCDIFCLPSREDMGPLVCVEAMAQSKPIVSTFVGGIPEMVVDGETGILVPSDSVSALTEALHRLVADRSLRLRMGEAGRRRYEAYYTQEKMAQHTFAVYHCLLKNH